MFLSPLSDMALGAEVNKEKLLQVSQPGSHLVAELLCAIQIALGPPPHDRLVPVGPLAGSVSVSSEAEVFDNPMKVCGRM